jgi:hypothetical protein
MAISSALCFVIVSTVVIGMNLGYTNIDVAGAFLVPTVLCLITVPFIRMIETHHGTGLTNIVTAALVAKMVGAYVRYLVMNHVYDGNDSGPYHEVGSAAAQAFLEGERSLWSLFPHNYGTRFIEQLNGVVALLSGRSMLASYMVFSWFGFFGLWAFVAAFRHSLPQFNVRRYAILTFFLPSALFWPSSLGKEAWMLLGIGLFTLGTSQLLTNQLRGIPLVIFGTVATAVVRPHFTALLLAALLLALIFGRGGRSTPSPIATLITVMFIIVGGVFAYRQIAGILPDSQNGLKAILEASRRRTSTGGSEIAVTIPDSPLEIPRAFFTVLFRPMPFEVQSVTQLFSALETTVVLGAFLVYRRQVLFAVRLSLKLAYLQFVAAYTIAFVFAWSSIGNLGIIARQRSLVLPFLLVFLCVGDRRTSTHFQYEGKYSSSSTD